jgi:regulator of protease activity HflC (stomatin/prohibitin superfamily)
MTASIRSSATRETQTSAISGYIALCVHLLWIVAAITLFVTADGNHTPSSPSPLFFLAIGGLALGVLGMFGYFTLQPNEARIQILFGQYKGTIRKSGFFWANPFYSRRRRPQSRNAGSTRHAMQKDLSKLTESGVDPANSTKISLRAHNFNSETLKVNDKRGNPVEIAAVVVWHVRDTAQAVFDVDDYKSYLQVQSEAAIRGIASGFAYDHGEAHEPTLRGSADEVAQALQVELQARLSQAGVTVEEARLTHLAYAPEIASVMLRRQQAEAIVAARQQIVQGAVGMVRTALQELDAQNIVQLDPERKAAMVSNLLVVLCGNADASPVINTGTLYS